MTLDFISARGNTMPLVNNEWFYLAGVDGMTKTDVSLSTSTVLSMDGDTVNNTQAQPRQLVLYLEIKPGRDVEDAKRYITSFVKPKLPGSLRWSKNERNIEITGIVQAADMPRFSQKCIMMITIYCSAPYWSDVEYLVTEISNLIDMHYFPANTGGLYFPVEGVPFGAIELNRTKTFTNNGDVASGMLVTIRALSTVTNPVIYDLVTGKYIGITDTLQAGDEVIISTYKGKKTITKNGENIIDRIMFGSTFLQLEVGDNEFMIDSDDTAKDNMYFTLTYKRLYV